jgi:hypothetical protein
VALLARTSHPSLRAGHDVRHGAGSRSQNIRGDLSLEQEPVFAWAIRCIAWRPGTAATILRLISAGLETTAVAASYLRLNESA